MEDGKSFRTPPPRVSPPALPPAPRIRAAPTGRWARKFLEVEQETSTVACDATIVPDETPQLPASGEKKRRKIDSDRHTDEMECFFLLKPSALFPKDEDGGLNEPAQSAALITPSIHRRCAASFLKPRYVPFEECLLVGSERNDGTQYREIERGREEGKEAVFRFRPIRDPDDEDHETQHLEQEQYRQAQHRVNISPPDAISSKNAASHTVMFRAEWPTCDTRRALFND
uniref:Uncharacterized protein n=1 Tax=Odontella aurita TaxID=265563 RepID=A0A7S4NI53_9STRA|mmetsp:Transcript_743/g.2187  ORF Transcript_743/g.2187 Transcript_743/m.2187 type:complete len:229 (+) Transcript_743:178-864(+)